MSNKAVAKVEHQVVSDSEEMSAWTVKDKSQTWETACDLAWSGEPQFVTRGGNQTVVIISCADYRSMHTKRRRIVKNSKLAFTISDEDLFSDDSSMWEATSD